MQKSPLPMNGYHPVQDAIHPSMGLMERVRDKLMLSMEELQRMEDEGGITITPQQAAVIEVLWEEMRDLSVVLDTEKPN